MPKLSPTPRMREEAGGDFIKSKRPFRVAKIFCTSAALILQNQKTMWQHEILSGNLEKICSLLKI